MSEDRVTWARFRASLGDSLRLGVRLEAGTQKKWLSPMERWGQN